jgi:hypothetical protein
MADTDLPNGFGESKPTPRRPRPITSPFGVMPTPGFNVVDPQDDQGPGLMDNLWASRSRCPSPLKCWSAPTRRAMD